MLRIDPDALREIQPELKAGETVLWAGRPSDRLVFRDTENPSLRPRAVLTGVVATCQGILIVWCLLNGAEGGTLFHIILGVYGVAALLAGQYIFWGRFLYDQQKKDRTYYAVTDRRVIVVQDWRGRRVVSAEIDSVPVLLKEKGPDGIGTIRFVPAPELYSFDRQQAWTVLALDKGPIFVDIEDADAVYQLISAKRTRASEEAVAEILRSRPKGGPAAI